MIKGRKVIYDGDTELYYPIKEETRLSEHDCICWDFPLTEDEMKYLECKLFIEEEE